MLLLYILLWAMTNCGFVWGVFRMHFWHENFCHGKSHEKAAPLQRNLILFSYGMDGALRIQDATTEIYIVHWNKSKE